MGAYPLVLELVACLERVTYGRFWLMGRWVKC